MHYEKKYDIFISYSHCDKMEVLSFKARLEKYGYLVWLDDEEILVGESIRQRVSEGISQSHCICFWVTENWKKSRFSNFELDTVFMDDNKGIFVILERGVAPPGLFSGRKYIVRDSCIDALTLYVHDQLKVYFASTVHRHYNIIKSEVDVESSVMRLGRMISLYSNRIALEILVALMGFVSLSITTLDYCYRYFHIAFRNKMTKEILDEALACTEKLVAVNNEIIIDKLCYAIGEIYLYAANDEAKNFAQRIIETHRYKDDFVGQKMSYTANRVNLK